MLVLSITFTSKSQSKNFVRLDLSSILCFKSIDISYGHKISDRWSIEGEVAFNYGRFIKGKDQETLSHNANISYPETASTDDTSSKHLTEAAISARFWPQYPFEGPVLCIGGIIKGNTPDIFSCIGYVLPICKGLCAEIRYRIYIMETIRNRKLQYNGIRIGLSYAF